MTQERVAEYEIGESAAGQRIDKFLAAAIPDRSRAQVQELIRDGFVTVAGTMVKPSHRLTAGTVVVARIPPQEATQLVAQPIPLDIIFEDRDVVVVNKPAGMVVHPGPGHEQDTLVNALLARYPDLAGLTRTEGAEAGRPGIVHRLDKPTSGLILVARNDQARRFLQEQFRQRQVEKTYVALVVGRLHPPHGIIDAPIGRDPHQRQRMAVVQQGGRSAQTVYHLVEYVNDDSLVAVSPVTGRTHQIRVHFAAIGHPIVGDRQYGHRRPTPGLRRQFLHAWKLALRLPSGERREFVAPVPADLLQALRGLAGRVPEALL